MGFRLRKPRPQVAQADPLKIAAAKKLRRLARRADGELWSWDECHFQQHGSRYRMWVPPEDKDPIVLHAPTRKSVACFGEGNLRTPSVRPHDLQGVQWRNLSALPRAVAAASNASAVSFSCLTTLATIPL
jgi:hypothetical protein